MIKSNELCSLIEMGPDLIFTKYKDKMVLLLMIAPTKQ